MAVRDLEVDAGRSIDNVAVDAVGICQVTGDNVRFVFNGITMLVTPQDTDPATIARRYRSAYDLKSKTSRWIEKDPVWVWEDEEVPW